MGSILTRSVRVTRIGAVGGESRLIDDIGEVTTETEVETEDTG